MDFPTLLAQLERAPRSGYRYPDCAAAIEAKLPASKREAEHQVRAEAIARAFGPEHPVRGVAIDAGCGDGEYLHELAERFEHVVGIDPDADRAAIAQEHCPEVRIFAIGLDLPVLADPSFDGLARFTQCLQVLGHVPCDEAGPIVARLTHLLSRDGFLLLAVPYTNTFADDFRISDLGVLESRRVAREEYDDNAREPLSGTLPVRHFAMPSILRLLEEARLVQVSCTPYGWLDYEHADLMMLLRRA